MAEFLPKTISLPGKPIFFGGRAITVTLNTGLCIFVGPNGAGKSEVLRWLRDHLRQREQLSQDRKVLYLSSGRSSLLEIYRSVTGQSGPTHIHREPAAIGAQGWGPQWWQFEGTTGMLLRLKDRSDLLLKVEATLQALYQRRLKLEWTQSGLQVGFSPTTGGKDYFANDEASGIIEFIPLLAAIYDDEVGALLVDEPEISLHPQLQTFLLQEMEKFAGDPNNHAKKLIVIATHSPTMLPLRRIKDIPRLVFFTDQRNPPTQINAEAGELKSVKLGALIARLSENHKLAFFARNVLLVEGPSDEIVVSGLALMLEHPLLGSNTQVVPVTGKGQFGETVKLFRLMGKNVFVLADLDSLADDNQLVSVFHDGAQAAANAHGAASITDIDRSIRNTLNTLLNKAFDTLSVGAQNHRYWQDRGKTPDEELKAKRRATVAALFLTPEEALKDLLSGELLALRKRHEVLLDILATAGCIILRRGTIEDYYFDNQSLTSLGKPEAAATEMETLSAHSATDIRERYEDIIRAIEISAPLRKIDENALLREQLASLLGAALQIVRPGMPDDELNARTAANFSSTTPIFRFTNRSTQTSDAPFRRVEVSMKSPLFVRDCFPFVVTEQDNLTLIVGQKLNSV